MSALLPGSQALLVRQLLRALRMPRALWLFGGALLFVFGGFLITYSAQDIQIVFQSGDANIGTELLNSYSWTTFLALSLFAPLIGVHAFAKEREAGTLDLLLTAGLQPYNLIFAKTAVSFIFILTALSGTLPLLSLTLLMGGVGPNDIILYFLQHGSIAFLALSIGVWAGAKSRTILRGLIAAYLTFVIFEAIKIGFIFIVLACIAFFTRSSSLVGMGPDLANASTSLLMIPIGIIFLNAVPYYLNREAGFVRHRKWKPIRISGRESQLWSLLGTKEYDEPIPAGANPVYIAERQRFFLQVVRRYIDAPSLLWIFSTIAFLLWIDPGAVLFLSLLIVSIVIPIVGAGSLTGEYERGTWESIRSTMLSHGQILHAKLRLCIGQGLIQAGAFYIPALPLLAVVWIMLAAGDGNAGWFEYEYLFPVWGQLILNIPVIVAAIIFLTLFSTWCSAVFRTSFLALTWSFGGSIFFMFGPRFLSSLHPYPSELLNGNGPLDLYSIILAMFHAPYVFNIWPNQASRWMTHLGKFLDNTPKEFWMLYLAHLILMGILSLLLYLDIRRRMHLLER